MKRFFKFLFGLGAAVFLVSAYSAGMKDAAMYADRSPYIEVCSRGLAHVPPGTRYVTCQGKVMRVIAIVPSDEGGAQTQAEGVGNCWCPQCCGGYCGVVVNCGASPEPEASDSSHGPNSESSRTGGLCTAYLACGD
jgi:hypothetical protein